MYSSSLKEYLNHLHVVFKRLEEAGLTAKPKKCQLGMKECVYLGHVVGEGKVQPENSKIEAIQKIESPKTQKDVRSFLGMTGYYQKFIPHYSTIACPPTDLTQKSKPNKVNWTKDCEEAFKKWKLCLCSAPILCSPTLTNRLFCKLMHQREEWVPSLVKLMTRGWTVPLRTSVVNYCPENNGILPLPLRTSVVNYCPENNAILPLKRNA